MPSSLRGCHPAVAGDDLALVIDEHGIAESKPLDAFRDLPDLFLGVRACVTLIRSERLDCDGLDLHKTSSPFEASVIDARNEFKHRDPAAAPHGSAFAQSEDCAW